MIIVDYIPESGRIMGVISYPMSDYEEMYPGKIYLGNTSRVDDSRHYVRDGMVVDRPEQPIEFDGRIIRGAIAGSQVFIDGEEYLADGTDIELEFGHSGVFKIVVKLFPYVTWEVRHRED